MAEINNHNNNFAEQQNDGMEKNPPVQEAAINPPSQDSSPDPDSDASNGASDHPLEEASHPLEEPDLTLRLSSGKYDISLARCLEMNEGAPLPPKDFLSLAPPCLFPPARTWVERLIQPQQQQRGQNDQSQNRLLNIHARVRTGGNMFGDRVIRLDQVAVPAPPLPPPAPLQQQQNWPMGVPSPMFPQQLVSFVPTDQQQCLFPQPVNIPQMSRLNGSLCKLAAVVTVGRASQAHGQAPDQPLFSAARGVIHFGSKEPSDQSLTCSVAATQISRYLPGMGNHPLYTWFQGTSSRNGEAGTSEEAAPSTRRLKRKGDEVPVHEHIRQGPVPVIEPVIEPARNEENGERAAEGILLQEAAPNDEGTVLNPAAESIDHADDENVDNPTKDNVEGSDPPSPPAN